VRQAGNWEIEGTAHIPYEGRNDVIMHWEIHVRFGNGVKMTILPGSDLTKFIGTEGWVGIRRRGLEAEPASLLKTQLGPDDVHLMESTNHGANFVQAIKEHHDPVSNIDDAVLSDAFSHLPCAAGARSSGIRSASRSSVTKRPHAGSPAPGASPGRCSAICRNSARHAAIGRGGPSAKEKKNMSDTRHCAPLTRRRWLQSAAAVGLAPLVIKGRALGAEDKPPASERITLGIIGCGGRGTADLQGLVSQGAQCVAACDVYKDRRERIAQRFGATAYADFRELLARPDIDAVLIATPEHWHALMCVEACRHGKDVFCEKPLSLTIREAQAVAAAARRYDRVFQTGTQQRSDPRFRFACELVRNGYIGRIKSVFAEPGGTSRWCNLPAQPVPEGLDWDMWLGPAAWAPYHRDRCVDLWHWWHWREYSGGLMTDRGAHDYDIVQWGLGMDGSGPVEVYPPGTPGFKMLTYRYANGVLLESSDGGWGSSSRRSALVVFKGTKGSVSVWRGGIETDPPELATLRSRRRNRRQLGDGLPHRQHRPMGGPAAAVGSGRKAVPGRRRGQPPSLAPDERALAFDVLSG